MTLLHATWLPRVKPEKNCEPKLLLWADTWRPTSAVEQSNKPPAHPFLLTSQELQDWLTKNNLLPPEFVETCACLTIPSKELKTNHTNKSSKEAKHRKLSKTFWEGVPLQDGEQVPKTCEWWPWRVTGLAMEINIASGWLSKMPLSKSTLSIGDEVIWWSHLQRWTLNLVAKGRWLPQIEKSTDNNYKAKWIPLLNKREDRQVLEELGQKLPQIATCALALTNNVNTNEDVQKSQERIYREFPSASHRPLSGRIQVIHLLEDLLDSHLRTNFKPNTQELDPLLKAWTKALSSPTKELTLTPQESFRLNEASTTWKKNIAGNLTSARTCLELIAPTKTQGSWKLNFYLQSEADPTLKIPASSIWSVKTKFLQLGNTQILQSSEILLEGLGRALKIFKPIERGLENSKPESIELNPAEAFILVRSGAEQLRDIGIEVELPPSLSGGVASRLGLSITAELPTTTHNLKLGVNLDWQWGLMIGEIKLSINDLEKLVKQKSPLVIHQGSWIELRAIDITNIENFCKSNIHITLDDALRLTATEGETLCKLPVLNFDAGPRLNNVLEKYHQQKLADALPTPKGFQGELRPYQEKGLGWLAFLHRFNQGACLADDMGLGKTIQLLGFIQHLKNNQELQKPILLIAPTSVMNNWIREGKTFTPNVSLYEHYGSKRITNLQELRKTLNNINLVITSYNIIQRDFDFLSSIDWQGVVIDEAQAIKNSESKQSESVRAIANKGNMFRIALTGTPIENEISEIWSLMNFLNPSILGDKKFFQQRYQLPIERYGDISSLKDLRIRVNPFILRRLKTDKKIITELPDKIELTEWVELGKEQKILYNKTVSDRLDQIATAPKGKQQGQVLALLLKLKQICNHPSLALKEKDLDKDFLSRSIKLQRLEELLEELAKSEDRALLFTQFAEWGHLLQSYLQHKWKEEIPFLFGGTTKSNRQRMIDKFQEDPRGPKILILSLKAGGVGLNLTRASHVFHIDRWWNPAVENQATDRAYRIGQSKRVIVHKFITRGSVEEKIDDLIQKKTKLSEELVGSGEEWLGKLDIDNLKKLVRLEENGER